MLSPVCPSVHHTGGSTFMHFAVLLARGGRIKMLHPVRLVSPIFSKQESYKNFKFSET